MKFLYRLQYKYGKYAIKGLTKYIIAAYIVGYILEIISTYSNNQVLYYLTLHPGLIVQGQIWRLFTWLLTPPTAFGIFTIIMLIVYYQLGTVLERVWGDFLYNIFIFFGLICTVVGAFLYYFLADKSIINATAGSIFSTYYVSLSIFLGFAMTFPDQQMLLFFFIPIKIKYLAVVYGAYMIYQIVTIPYWVMRIQIICSMASVIVLVILKFSAGKQRRDPYHAAQAQRKPQYKKVVHPAAGSGVSEPKKNGALHKCCICGQTEIDNPDLDFRYCSKCTGNKEYCSNHLFTHQHI